MPPRARSRRSSRAPGPAWRTFWARVPPTSRSPPAPQRRTTSPSRAALIVDELIGQQQVVVKNLETHYKRIPHVSGATILGNGRVALILDIATLVQAR